MKKGMLLLLFFFLLCSFSHAQYVTLEGRQFKDENGNDFYPVVCNFSTEYLFTSSEPFFPSPGKDHDGHCYDCDSFLSCLEQFSDNFDKIKEMNFNAIRLYMINPVYFKETPDSINGWALKTYDYEFLNSVDCWTQLSEKYYTKPVYLSQTFGPDTVLDRILLYYDSVLLRAARSSLKVLLNVGVAKGDFSYEFIAGYGTYLALVADHFGSGTPVPGSKEDSIRKTILAYVILEEPSVSWKTTTMWPSVTTGHSKQDVCQFISSLYDTLKLHDPHHLVTVGGVPYDLFEFDPGVMKLDFYSPHIYTQKRSYMGAGFFQGMLDEAHSWFYWMANNAPMPYLIGETGFKSKYMDDNHLANQGTNWQQKLYADSTLKSVKDCKGSGYSWWYYQDYYWGNPHEGFFGLLGRRPGTNQTEEKPVVAAFETFNPATPTGTMTRPASYYDPFHHSQYAKGTNKIKGHVQDLNNIPIRNAYIRGQTRLHGEGEDIWLDTHYTFTNDSGNFILIPYDFDTTSPNYNVIETLYITAPGCSRFDTAVWGQPGISDNQTYVLDCSSFSYYDTLKSIIVGQSEKNLFQSWAELLVYDSVFVYGEGEFTARLEVSIENEFQSYSGSETWIHYSDAFPICDSVPMDNIPMKSSNYKLSSKSSGLLPGDIEVSFLKSNENCGLIIYPNPSSGIFTISIPDECMTGEVFITIFDQMTRKILEISVTSNIQQIDLSETKQGLYYLVLSDQNSSYSKKIIIL